MFKKSLQDILFDKTEDESLCENFPKYLRGTKKEKLNLFHKHEHKSKN